MVMPPIASLTVNTRMISVAVVVLAMLGMHHVNAARCPQPCLSGVCDDVTGNCVVDWGSGVDSHSQVTRIGCPRGFHGNDCTQVCPANCINSTCSQATGQCTQGCKTGFTGSDCTSVCPEGFHGENCALPCPERCLNSTCTPQSGVCSSGCVEGFWGSDCSLAQGKSVLLYLLTSRYEHALARVQFEIERAVQDRNEIQDILQG